METETESMESMFRRAENYSMAKNSQSSFGVAIQSTQTVIFKGGSYANRTASFDEIYPRSDIVSVTAPSEIVFSQISGVPNSSSTITLSNSSKSQVINLNTQGSIDW